MNSEIRAFYTKCPLVCVTQEKKRCTIEIFVNIFVDDIKVFINFFNFLLPSQQLKCKKYIIFAVENFYDKIHFIYIIFCERIKTFSISISACVSVMVNVELHIFYT